jgi:hypothetical protein
MCVDTPPPPTIIGALVGGTSKHVIVDYLTRASDWIREKLRGVSDDDDWAIRVFISPTSRQGCTLPFLCLDLCDGICSIAQYIQEQALKRFPRLRVPIVRAHMFSMIELYLSTTADHSSPMLAGP